MFNIPANLPTRTALCLTTLMLFGYSLPINAQIQGDGAEFINQTVPTAMMAGQPYIVLVTMKNNGTTTWLPDGNYQLASLNPANDAFLGAVSALPVLVPPGTSHTFVFNFVAPKRGTKLNFQWGMRNGPGAWFGAHSPETVATLNSRTTQRLIAAAGIATNEQYEYNALGRLTKVRVDGTVKTDYKYDSAGNRTTVTE